MILTKNAILNEIKLKSVKITPFKKENIGRAQTFEKCLIETALVGLKSYEPVCVK